MNRGLVRSFGTYLFIAATVVGFGSTTRAIAVMNLYDNGGVGWHDNCPVWGSPDVKYDMIQFSYDGTVLVDDVEIDALGSDVGTFTLGHDGEFPWALHGPLDASIITAGAGSAFMIGGPMGGMPDKVVKLDADHIVTGGGVGTYWAKGSIGAFQGNSGGAWEPTDWIFGGRGYVGLYSVQPDGVHYGWADIWTSEYRNSFTLYSFGFSDIPYQRVYAGGDEVPEPVTLSLLAVGAVGLLTRRRRA